MQIENVKGFVSDYNSGYSAYIQGKTILPIVSFAVGEPPVNLYYLSFSSQPLSASNYVAVAYKRSLVIQGAHVALAYRNLGDLGKAHSMDVSFPSAFVLFGMLGAFGGIFLGPLNNGLKGLAAGLLAIGAFGLWRLWSMRRACHMLNLLPSSLSTYPQRQ